MRKTIELMCSEQEKVQSNLGGPDAAREISRFALEPMIQREYVGAAELTNLCIKSTWHYWSMRRAEEDAAARGGGGSAGREGGGAGEGKEDVEEEDEEEEEGSGLSPCDEMLTMFTTFLADLLAKKFVRVEDGRVEGGMVERGKVEDGKVDGGEVEGGMVQGGKVLTLSRLAKSMAIVNFSADQGMLVDEEIKRQFADLVQIDLHFYYLFIPVKGECVSLPKWKTLLSCRSMLEAAASNPNDMKQREAGLQLKVCGSYYRPNIVIVRPNILTGRPGCSSRCSTRTAPPAPPLYPITTPPRPTATSPHHHSTTQGVRPPRPHAPRDRDRDEKRRADRR